MGIIEQKSKILERRKRIQRIILSVVVTAGVVTAASLNPKVLRILWKDFKHKNKRQNEYVNLSRDRLVSHGLLVRDKDGFLKPTLKGEMELRHLELSDFKLKRPKKWDGKWRILIFDIQEVRRGVRDKIRRCLISIGFVKLQQSVWIFPYDCEDLITLLKADFGIGKRVLYIIAENVEYDTWLRETFGLTDN